MSAALLERYAADPEFRAFVDAQRGQDAVELAALKVEYAHQAEVIAQQSADIKELRQAAKGRK